jgi:hypothetical protein
MGWWLPGRPIIPPLCNLFAGRCTCTLRVLLFSAIPPGADRTQHREGWVKATRAKSLHPPFTHPSPTLQCPFSVGTNPAGYSKSHRTIVTRP